MREKPKELEVYRHFKGTYYQVIAVARHTEYDEELVIYRPLFEQGQVWARPLRSFMSEVDKDAYPTARQQYRFTLATGNSHGGRKEQKEPVRESEPSAYEQPVYEQPAYVQPAYEPTATQSAEETSCGFLEERSDSVLDPDLESFLDAGSFEKKLDIFLLLRRRMTDDMLQNIAISLDMQLSGETLEDRCNEVLACIMTRKKYESDRLR
ncbi:MAG: DUF1653 domain-containing protein [Lachnospiraceae bacterium]|nr:DUF1653 domain-containing protein [Lachnospiraceae bacterium]